MANLKEYDPGRRKFLIGTIGALAGVALQACDNPAPKYEGLYTDEARERARDKLIEHEKTVEPLVKRFIKDDVLSRNPASKFMKDINKEEMEIILSTNRSLDFVLTSAGMIGDADRHMLFRVTSFYDKHGRFTRSQEIQFSPVSGKELPELADFFNQVNSGQQPQPDLMLTYPDKILNYPPETFFKIVPKEKGYTIEASWHDQKHREDVDVVISMQGDIFIRTNRVVNTPTPAPI